MNITVIYASGRGSRSCSRGIAGMLIDELMKEKEIVRFELDGLYEKWEQLSEEAGG